MRLGSVGLALVATLLGAAPGLRAAEQTLKITLVLPPEDVESGIAAEVAAGAALAAQSSNDTRAGGAPRPAVEIVAAPGGGAGAVEKAAKEKQLGVVAFVPEKTAVEMESAARKAKLPLVFAGPGGPTRTLDANDPVFRVEPSPADRGLRLAEWLRLRSAKASVGIPSRTQHAWVVAEDVAWARAVDASLRADDTESIVTGESSVVPTGGEVSAADIAKARGASCDRVVVIGGAKTLRATALALDRAGWDVPVLALDASLDGAALQPTAGGRRKFVWLCATPTWTAQQKPEETLAKHPRAAGQPSEMTPAAWRGFTATLALVRAAVLASKKTTVPSLRDEHEGSGATEGPLFDPTGSTDRWSWALWASGADGAAAPVKPSFLPDPNLGLFLGGHPGARHRAVPGQVACRVGYGGGDGGPPRTIEDDLGRLGLAGADETANGLVREQILARACSKLSRVWRRSYDGSARPAYSFRIAFVPEGTDTAGASATWEASIAGDGPDGDHGGRSNVKALRAQALSTYLLRHAEMLQKARLTTKLAASDVPYLDGSYAWNTSAEGNDRSDRIRALVDGVASTFCMKLSKEVGHLAGLPVDHSGEPRSVMVAKGGEGVSDEFAYFPPSFAKILERTLGRVGADGR